MVPKAKILITGATGFIGSRLALYLANLGHDVHGLGRSKNTQTHPFQMHWIDNAFEELRDLIKSIQPDCCFHLATHFKAQHSYEDIPAMIDGNIRFGTLLADALVQANVPLLVNTGTVWQNYEGKEYSPVCLYAGMKQAFEDILKYYSELHPLRVLNLKLTDTYGPGDQRRKLLNILRECTLAGKPFQTSDGENWIDLIHVEDAVAGFTQAWKILRESSEAFQSYRLTSGHPVKIRNLVELFQKGAGKNIEIQWNALPQRPREMREPWDAGPVLPGWKAKWSLQDGIRNIMN